jgi:hypothetical protein
MFIVLNLSVSARVYMMNRYVVLLSEMEQTMHDERKEIGTGVASNLFSDGFCAPVSIFN